MIFTALLKKAAFLHYFKLESNLFPIDTLF